MQTPEYYKKVPTVLERLPAHVQVLSHIMNIVKYNSRAGVKKTSETDFCKDFAKGMHYMQFLMAYGIDTEEKLRLLVYGTQLGTQLTSEQLDLFPEELRVVDESIITSIISMFNAAKEAKESVHTVMVMDEPALDPPHDAPQADIATTSARIGSTPPSAEHTFKDSLTAATVRTLRHEVDDELKKLRSLMPMNRSINTLEKVFYPVVSKMKDEELYLGICTILTELKLRYGKKSEGAAMPEIGTMLGTFMRAYMCPSIAKYYIDCVDYAMSQLTTADDAELAIPTEAAYTKYVTEQKAQEADDILIYKAIAAGDIVKSTDKLLESNGNLVNVAPSLVGFKAYRQGSNQKIYRK